ncbi:MULTISPECIES: flavin reductase family protein [unclassified Streptomyces]|uniref:flavin reductase family protein n=1 Tax=unclassified Streptomyces TaxID=2593676 RepID=UPI002E293866|nr:flavin reductase family protein [Streptomyces sp. NBC_00223]
MTTTRAQCLDDRRQRPGPRAAGRPPSPNGRGEPTVTEPSATEPSEVTEPGGAGEPSAVTEPSVVDAALHPTELRRVFGAFPTGVTAIAALVDGVPVGLAANSFTSVSLDPPLVSVCVAHTSTTWPALSGLARLGVSVLGSHQERACTQLAARGGDRFADLDWTATDDGAVLIDGASAWFDTSVEQHIRAGDHDIVLLRVHALDADPAVVPLVFHSSRFRRLEAAAAPHDVPQPHSTASTTVKETS